MSAELKNRHQKPKFNSSREYLEKWIGDAARFLPSEGLILDAGAGNSPYRSLFSHARYESADFCKVDKDYAEVNYVCDLASIPVEDNRYDMIICTQVLEHVNDPKAVLKELHRILKPNAELWLSAPLFYQEHEIPHDYYRYTQFGFKYLLQSAGFKLKSIDWLEGYYGTLSYQLETAAKSLPLNYRCYGKGLMRFPAVVIIFILKQIFSFSSVMFANLDMQYKNVSTGYCKNYAIIAVK